MARISRPKDFRAPTFAKLAREGRKRAQKTQHQAGAAAGWHQSYVSLIDKGEALPRNLRDLIAYLRIIQVDVRIALAALVLDLGPATLERVFLDYASAVKSLELDMPELPGLLRESGTHEDETTTTEVRIA